MREETTDSRETTCARKITRLNDDDYVRLIKYYAGLKPEEQIAVHDLQTRISQRKSNLFEKEHRGAFYFATFVISILEYKKAQGRSAELQRMSFHEAKTTDRLRQIATGARASRKPSEAKTFVAAHFKEIADLKREGKGSRRIVNHLLQKYGGKISHASLLNHFEKFNDEGGF